MQLDMAKVRFNKDLKLNSNEKSNRIIEENLPSCEG